VVVTDLQGAARTGRRSASRYGAGLKGMGAVYLQNGVCLLPKTDDHARRLKMLENEVAEMGGETVILETVALDRGQEDKVVARFQAIVTTPTAS